MLHDGELQRVAGSQHAQRIGALTAEEADSIDVGSWFGPQYAAERIPRLAHVLLLYRNHTHLHVELKSTQPALPSAVAAKLRDCGWITAESLVGHAPADAASAAGSSHAAASFAVPGLTITSFHLQQLHASMQLLPGVRHGWLVQRIDEGTLDEASHAGVHGIYPRANAATADAVAAALAQGFSVRAWGVKTVELLRQVRSCGCQGATVDWPDVARTALASNFEGIGLPQLQLDD